ncbi:DNA topology modulation protein FlaR [Brevibacillus choshinensis]|uniref:DNA topology modulation protein FlaR n=1 Tax=Brevibacillus choshinensis TaxID=54911 RepID=UPI002E1AC1A7|nr:DNA topology modulation protein FlaR [Brevibacillus choshinensis]
MDGTLNKIHIIGAVGSGKTTLARKLFTSLSLPLYELDNLVWERRKEGDIRRPPELRDAYLNEMIQLDRWIIEGAQHLWVNQSFQQADLIILLDVPYRQRVTQIMKRYVLQKAGMEKAHYTPSLQLLKKMFEWNNDYQNYERESILRMLEPYKNKLQIISSKKETKAFLDAAVIPLK